MAMAAAKKRTAKRHTPPPELQALCKTALAGREQLGDAIELAEELQWAARLWEASLRESRMIERLAEAIRLNDERSGNDEHAAAA